MRTTLDPIFDIRSTLAWEDYLLEPRFTGTPKSDCPRRFIFILLPNQPIKDVSATQPINLSDIILLIRILPFRAFMIRRRDFTVLLFGFTACIKDIQLSGCGRLAEGFVYGGEDLGNAEVLVVRSAPSDADWPWQMWGFDDHVWCWRSCGVLMESVESLSSDSVGSV